MLKVVRVLRDVTVECTVVHEAQDYYLGKLTRNRLSSVKLFCPCGRWTTLHSTRVIRYFAIFCWRMRLCARQKLGVIFNFLTNNFADNMSTLKDSVTSLLAMRTNECLLRVILTFIVTPFNIYSLIEHVYV